MGRISSQTKYGAGPTAGTRIISSERLEFLRRVPQSLVDIFKIGSTTPGEQAPSLCVKFSVHCQSSGGRIVVWTTYDFAGALLFDARSLFDQQNPKADEVLRSIIDVLPTAVGNCVEAAGAELDVSRQSALLKVGPFQNAAAPLSLCGMKGTNKLCKQNQDESLQPCQHG